MEKNCRNCKYCERFQHGLIGCSKQCVIIPDPDKEKEACFEESTFSQMLRDPFGMWFA